MWLKTFPTKVNLQIIYSKLIGVPSHLNVDYIKESLMKIEDVYSVEDLNIWSLTSGKATAIVHMQLSMLLMGSWGQASVLWVSIWAYHMYEDLGREEALQKMNCRSKGNKGWEGSSVLRTGPTMHEAVCLIPETPNK